MTSAWSSEDWDSYYSDFFHRERTVPVESNRSSLYRNTFGLSNSVSFKTTTISTTTTTSGSIYLSPVRANAMRSQRDVSLNETISDIVVFGVNLNNALLNHNGYVNDSLSDISNLLNIGAQILEIDLYYNEKSREWQLCPAPFYPNVTSYSDVFSYSWNNKNYLCSKEFSLTNLFSVVNDFISNTDTRLSANLLYMLFNIKSLWPDYSYTDQFISNVNETDISLGEIVSAFLTKIVTPNQVPYEDFPTLSRFLFSDIDRVVPIVLTNQLSSNTTYTNITSDYRNLYFGGVNIDVNNTQLYSSNSQSFLTENCTYTNIFYSDDTNNDSYIPKNNYAPILFGHDTEEQQYSLYDFKSQMLCGISPIINHDLSNIDSITGFLSASFWSWAPLEPANTTVKYQIVNDKLYRLPVNSVSDAPEDLILAAEFLKEDPEDYMGFTSPMSNGHSTTGAITQQDSTTAEIVNGYQTISESPQSTSGISLSLDESFTSTALKSNKDIKADTDVNAWQYGDSGDDNIGSSDEAYNFRCAILKDDGWHTRSCYLPYNVACKIESKSDGGESFNSSTYWKITQNRYDYFAAESACKEEFDGYEFSVPTTAAQQNLLLSSPEFNSTKGCLIDMNSLSSSGCWVSGGAQARCPYQRYVSYLIFVQMIVPSSIIAFLLFVLIISLHFDRVPIQKNRKYWKKLLNEKLQNDYDGVPS
ncbi:hypothetical protein BVG19_g746 [[Candida] boidinii]|nr:hypothetical protein BVG19_g746 [[Candida] boidinii]OWB49246.1 hypothetical protein B5S27_g786 [[Candida] boidinii]